MGGLGDSTVARPREASLERARGASGHGSIPQRELIKLCKYIHVALVGDGIQDQTLTLMPVLMSVNKT